MQRGRVDNDTDRVYPVLGADIRTMNWFKLIFWIAALIGCLWFWVSIFRMAF